MHTKRNKNLSIFSLVTGYLFIFIFVLLIILQDSAQDSVVTTSLPATNELPPTIPEDNKTVVPLFISSNPIIERTVSPSVLSPEIDEVIGEDSVFIDHTPLNVLGDGSRSIVHHSRNRDSFGLLEIACEAINETLTIDSDIDIGILDRRLISDDSDLLALDTDNDTLIHQSDDDFLVISDTHNIQRDPDNIGLDSWWQK